MSSGLDSRVSTGLRAHCQSDYVFMGYALGRIDGNVVLDYGINIYVLSQKTT